MGDRALIIFCDSDRVSPCVYLHWDGSNVPVWLEELKRLMQGRFGDAEYAAARFIGICHAKIDGNLSLGVISNRFTLAEMHDQAKLEEQSHGDAGVVVVNTADFTWKAYGGYLAYWSDHTTTRHQDGTQPLLQKESAYDQTRP
jgi:hypothetical protein